MKLLMKKGPGKGLKHRVTYGPTGTFQIQKNLESDAKPTKGGYMGTWHKKGGLGPEHDDKVSIPCLHIGKRRRDAGKINRKTKKNACWDGRGNRQRGGQQEEVKTLGRTGGSQKVRSQDGGGVRASCFERRRIKETSKVSRKVEGKRIGEGYSNPGMGTVLDSSKRSRLAQRVIQKVIRNLVDSYQERQLSKKWSK